MTDTTYILTVTAMPGHQEDVARFFRDLEPALRDANGFQRRKIYQTDIGVMAGAINKYFLGKEPSDVPPHEDKGTQFVVIETWDSIENRMMFSKSLSDGRNEGLKPHLLPQHSHEFYNDISVA